MRLVRLVVLLERLTDDRVLVPGARNNDGQKRIGYRKNWQRPQRAF
jgi:hypothetical protein